jgi:hypothetical protein
VDLQKTFKQLAKASSGHEADLEFVIVHDSAPGQFEHCEQLAEVFKQSVGCPVIIEHYDTVALHPETFHLDTHCNPVAVNNKLMDLASGDNLIWVSSDMIVSPMLFDRINLHLNDEGFLDTVWCSRVLDQDAMAEYCGPSRPFPMMWCIAHPATGERHDLNLLRGFGFDDNDWVARMGLKYGSVTIDLCHVAIHQTHGRVSKMGQLATGKAYSIESKPGWEASIKYMQAKWGGTPFDGKTLDIAYGEVGEFLVLNINGVKVEGAPRTVTEEADPVKPKPRRKKRVAKKRTKKS